MTIVRVGATKKYSDGWETAFGKGKKAAAGKKAAKKSTKSARGKKAKSKKRGK